MAAANSTTANSATSGHPCPPSGRQDSCHSSTGPTSDSAECIAAHRAAALSTCRAASSSTRFWSRAVGQHAGGVVSPESGSGSKVEVIVGPTQPPTTDTRPGPDHPCGQRVAAPRVCTESGPRPVPWGGSRRCRRCGGFETVAARPPQPPCGADPTTAGPQPARRRTGPRPRRRPSAGCGGFETVAARPPQPPSGADSNPTARLRITGCLEACGLRCWHSCFLTCGRRTACGSTHPD